jgi:hypothetical protein
MGKLQRRTLKMVKPAPRSAVGVSEEALAEALRESCGIQTAAGRMVGLSQSGVSRRIGNSEYLQEVIAEIREEILDICEDELFKKIKGGNLTALIYYTKCFGRSRGYLEKAELDVKQVAGGVLVVPGMAESNEQWLNMVAENETKKQED